MSIVNLNSTTKKVAINSSLLERRHTYATIVLNPRKNSVDVLQVYEPCSLPDDVLATFELQDITKTINSNTRF